MKLPSAGDTRLSSDESQQAKQGTETMASHTPSTVTGYTNSGKKNQGSAREIVCDVSSMVYLESREMSGSPACSEASTDSVKDYGAWGPVYKNRENFVEMHLC